MESEVNLVPVQKISAIEPGRVRFDARRSTCAASSAGPASCSWRRTSARRLINFVGGRIGPGQRDRARQNGNGWEVVGVDPTAARPLRRLLPALGPAGRCRRDRRLGQHRAVRRPRADGPAAHPLPQADAAAPGPDRRPGRGGLPRRGRGDHRGGRPGPRARGRRLRGARHRAPGRVRRGPLRRRGRPAARVDGARRRGGPDLRGRPGTTRYRSSSCSPSPSATRSARS